MVNFHGVTILDRFVRPKERVTDYRTHVSGIQPWMLRKDQGAITLKEAQEEVTQIIQDRVVVGHALHNDLSALLLSHPKSLIRDTSKYGVFKRMSGGRTPGLKRLAKAILGKDIQTGEHSSVSTSGMLCVDVCCSRDALIPFYPMMRRWRMLGSPWRFTNPTRKTGIGRWRAK